jgi:hypothetical protein
LKEKKNGDETAATTAYNSYKAEASASRGIESKRIPSWFFTLSGVQCHTIPISAYLAGKRSPGEVGFTGILQVFYSTDRLPIVEKCPIPIPSAHGLKPADKYERLFPYPA